MRVLVVALAGTLAVLSARPAAASRSPSIHGIVFSPSDPNLVVARASYGILPSHDNGGSWSYLCDDALGLIGDSYDDPVIGLTAGNALVVGLGGESNQGLEVSPDVGCSWSCVGGPLARQAIADSVVRPDKPHVALVLAWTHSASDAGISVVSGQVFQSADDGAHWAALGNPIDPSISVQTIDVSRADASGNYSIYVSGMRDQTASLLISNDEGGTWTEHPLPAFDPTTENSLDIGGVDPADPERLYLRTRAPATGGQSRLFMTTDGGASFTTLATFQVPAPIDGEATGEVLAFALSPDGSKIYAGTREDGLFVASRADMVFRKTSPIAVWCLATRGQELWVCSGEASNALGGPFVIGETTDDGAHFTSKLATITTLCGPLSCPAGTRTSLACNATVSGGQCQSAFDDLCQLFDVNAMCGTCASDAGLVADAAGAPGDASTVKPPSSTSSCGCSVTSAGGTGSLAAASAIAALVLGRRKKRR
ncbi:MAG TPA: MYXO-CTERM sorting domain-containing protein [Polyangiaceae bacterium]|nr:MYXO-CTERM sorting domain-containing protein [Polyangiaceae bacterium]